MQRACAQANMSCTQILAHAAACIHLASVPFWLYMISETRVDEDAQVQEVDRIAHLDSKLNQLARVESIKEAREVPVGAHGAEPERASDLLTELSQPDFLEGTRALHSGVRKVQPISTPYTAVLVPSFTVHAVKGGTCTHRSFTCNALGQERNNTQKNLGWPRHGQLALIEEMKEPRSSLDVQHSERPQPLCVQKGSRAESTTDT
ncbi:unnamed protein product [Prorocentrum cordatum]|uniref:Ig-like domain-containing protein n=1 Tax=Prorocentrum cordatum TaxID=2364126 RepID=A0ABN9RAV8_9DINO|nr:unnamed protein product [Polarella glacialis]